ncbi:hypothetical protein POTOM_057589 [Populus tomentosa]|uniref:Uncharacterized protein n=1 Tax=Populus tomentosa TaxID=118781 RepID=A0A8X7XTG7_POPTO|nr:hypothetical protein POTOM_057589 [Populus tomentosa]
MLVVFFLSGLKKIVERMHQTMCKRKSTVPFVNFKHNIKSECANITGCRHVDFVHIAIIFVDFLFLVPYDLPESHPRPLLFSGLLLSCLHFLSCGLILLSQLLHQYVISLDFIQSGKVMIISSPTMHLPTLGSYVHGKCCLQAITVRLEHDNKIMVTIRSIIVKYRAFP